MADNIADISLDGTWQSIYALTGITLGVPITLQNKSSYPVLGFISPTSPLVNSVSGYVIWPGETVIVDGVISNYWVRGNGPLFAQES